MSSNHGQQGGAQSTVSPALLRTKPQGCDTKPKLLYSEVSPLQQEVGKGKVQEVPTAPQGP